MNLQKDHCQKRGRISESNLRERLEKKSPKDFGKLRIFLGREKKKFIVCESGTNFQAPFDLFFGWRHALFSFFLLGS